jgi:electron transfer flavoprotein alpha subunit
MTVLVIAEHDNASIKGATLNTVTAAIACGAGDVHVLVAGHNAGAAAAAAANIAGVAKVIHADSEPTHTPWLKTSQPRYWPSQPTTATSCSQPPQQAKTHLPAWPPSSMSHRSAKSAKSSALTPFERPIYAGNAIATVQSTDADQSHHRARHGL